MFRSILNVKLKDKTNISDIKTRTKIRDIGYVIKKMKFKYAGYPAR